MAGTDQQGFRIVLRGYDIDAVDAFLVTQARAWGEALDEAKQQIAMLEREVARLRLIETDQERAEQDLAARTESAEIAAAVLREEAERKATETVEAAQVEANEILDEADRTHRARQRLELQKFESLQAELEVRHEDAMERYAKAEAILQAKVDDLAATREALVTGLEAIARGGLAGLNAEAEQALAAVGLGLSATATSEVTNEADASATAATDVAEAGPADAGSTVGPEAGDPGGDAVAGDGAAGDHAGSATDSAVADAIPSVSDAADGENAATDELGPTDDTVSADDGAPDDAAVADDVGPTDDTTPTDVVDDANLPTDFESELIEGELSTADGAVDAEAQTQEDPLAEVG